jgi:hypothetical protein
MISWNKRNPYRNARFTISYIHYMQKLAKETVIKQAEMLAEELAG